MSAVQVATRYASALLEEAVRTSQLDAVYADVRLLDDALSQSKDLVLMLKSPVVSPAAKQRTLRALFSDKVSSLTANFLTLLVRKRRESALDEIIPAFYGAYNDHNNIREVDVVSATPLTGSLRQAIMDRVQRELGQVTVRVNESVDPALLGGFLVKVGDRVFDSSLRNKLNALKREFLAS